MENESPLAGLAVVGVVVDGARAASLTPQTRPARRAYATAEAIGREAGISTESPRYSGLHDHCQYSRTC